MSTLLNNYLSLCGLNQCDVFFPLLCNIPLGDVIGHNNFVECTVHSETYAHFRFRICHPIVC